MKMQMPNYLLNGIYILVCSFLNWDSVPNKIKIGCSDSFKSSYGMRKTAKHISCEYISIVATFVLFLTNSRNITYKLTVLHCFHKIGKISYLN